MIPPVQNFGPDVEMKDRNVFVFKNRIVLGIELGLRVGLGLN